MSIGLANEEEISNGYVGPKLEIAIAGGGLGGLAAAIACALQGHSVTVYEQAAAISEVGAGIQCAPNVTRLFTRWKLDEALLKIAVQPKHINFRRWQNGKLIGLTDLTTFERDFGSPYLVIHRAHLLEALLDKARQLGVKVRLGMRVATLSVSGDSAILEFANGEKAEADLVVGADGIRSPTRKAILKTADSGPVATQFCAYRATVPAELLRAHPDTAALLAASSINLWIGPDRHVMSYPIAGGETFNMVLSHPAPAHLANGNRSTADHVRDMKEHYKDWDPLLVRIISMVETTMPWPLMVYPNMRSWTNEEKNCAMLGDGCHAMLPYMSSGAGMAIEDAASLATLLSRHDTKSPTSKREFISRALKLYEQCRTPRAGEVQRLSSLNGRIWHYPDGAAQQARDDGMAATLSSKHYVRSTNQWSNPSTQVWLYGHDAEATARSLQTCDGDTVRIEDQDAADIREMREAGLLI